MNATIDILNRVIRTRRSIFPRSYLRKEIPRSIIEEMLANATFAPSHKLTQPWKFRVFRKKGLERLAGELSRLYQENTPADRFLTTKYEATRNKVLQSDSVIAIVLKAHPEKLPEWEELASVACAVQNMWLTETAHGVGAYWISPGIISQLGAFLELSPLEKCVGLFYMGIHQETPVEAKRISPEEKTTWIEE
ncbi:MAG TPA: nitroreductase [Anseongella sp.]